MNLQKNIYILITSVLISFLISALLYLFFYDFYYIEAREVEILFFGFIQIFLFGSFVLLHYSPPFRTTVLRKILLIFFQLLIISSSYLISVKIGYLGFRVPESYYNTEFTEQELVNILDHYNKSIASFAYQEIEENLKLSEKKEMYSSLLWKKYFENEYVNSNVIDVLRLISMSKDEKIFPILDQMLKSEREYLGASDSKTGYVSYIYREYAKSWYKEYFDMDVDVETDYQFSFSSQSEFEKYEKKIKSTQQKIPIWK
jgi:hypothetical protein